MTGNEKVCVPKENALELLKYFIPFYFFKIVGSQWVAQSSNNPPVSASRVTGTVDKYHCTMLKKDFCICYEFYIENIRC